jgi:hypothetical protein
MRTRYVAVERTRNVPIGPIDTRRESRGRAWDLRVTRNPEGTSRHSLVGGASADRIMSRLQRWQVLNAKP